jgi:hypothetical protein
MGIWARRPRYSPGWIKQIKISLPLYRLPDQAGKVWTERRATGDLRGIVYGDADASLHVLTSALPGPPLRSLLPPGGRPTAVPVQIGGEVVTFEGLASADGWAVRAEFASYCVAIIGVDWPVSGLVLEEVAAIRLNEQAG